MANAARAEGAHIARVVLIGLLAAMVAALFSPLASPKPDGLEYVAEQSGFLKRALEPLYTLLPDYTVPIVGSGAITTILAVAIGALVVFTLILLVGRRLAPAAQRGRDRKSAKPGRERARIKEG